MRKNSLLNLLSRLIVQINKKRRIEFFFLLIIMILSGLAEVISLALVIPFIGLITNSELLWENNSIRDLSLRLGYTNPQELLLPITVIFCMACLVAAIIRLLNLYLNLNFAARLGSDISCKIYQNTLYQPYQYHISKNSSEVITNVVNDIGRVVGEVINPLLQGMSSFFIMLSITLTLILIDAKIATSTFLVITIFYLLIILSSKEKIKSLSSSQDIFVKKLVKALQEGVGGIRDILLNNAQSFYLKQYKSADFPLREAQAVGTFLSGFPRLIVEPVGIIVIAFFGFHLVKIGRQEEAIPLLGAIALGAQKLLPTAQKVYEGWTMAGAAKVQLKNVVILLEKNHCDKKSIKFIKNFSFKNEIVFKNVFFSYSNNSNYALKNVNLTIKKGERIGVLGTTGGGKSTFLDLVTCLLSPTRGEIIIDGKEINFDKNNRLLNSWRSIISHVPQFIYLSDTSLEENIAFASETESINRKKIIHSVRRAQIFEFINNLPQNFKTKVGERGIRLSGGQKQRIGIARALYKKSQIIIFDEATSALDYHTEELLMSSLNNLDKDITIIMVAHRISTLQNCDRLIKIENGEIIDV